MYFFHLLCNSKRHVQGCTCYSCSESIPMAYLCLYHSPPLPQVHLLFLYISFTCLCTVFRFGVFEPEERCFVTFNSDTLTVPLPNNSYQIYYTPVNNDTRKYYTSLGYNAKCCVPENSEKLMSPLFHYSPQNVLLSA